ncbi:hypothetical protein SCFA_170018 [anaerobic digester metagenome]|uniref:Uncharacterized protein n=1 Tax=anaerobic digester metagenome TaxID=1263854 RepID=A0A485LYZ5_9ZZZZ
MTDVSITYKYIILINMSILLCKHP